MVRSLLFGLLFLLTTTGETMSAVVVVRDSIGPDSTLTDGLPGGATYRNHNNSS